MFLKSELILCFLKFKHGIITGSRWERLFLPLHHCKNWYKIRVFIYCLVSKLPVKEYVWIILDKQESNIFKYLCGSKFHKLFSLLLSKFIKTNCYLKSLYKNTVSFLLVYSLCLGFIFFWYGTQSHLFVAFPVKNNLADYVSEARSFLLWLQLHSIHG